MRAVLSTLVQLQAPDDRSGSGRYERATNTYQDSLLSAYRGWVRGLVKALTGDAAKDRALITEQLPDLTRALQSVAQEELPNAIGVLGTRYVPSPDAYRMVAEAIVQAQADLDRLAGDVADKLGRALDEEADLASVAASLEPRLAQSAGAFWVLIMRAIGDFAAQAAGQDDEIYPCRWVLDPRAQHCEACPIYAGEYASYAAMLQVTNGSVPGYFVGSPYKSCWGNCRCHLELYIQGQWRRV